MKSLIWDWKEVENFYETVLTKVYNPKNNPYLKEGVSLMFLASRKNYYPKAVQPFVKSAIFIHREMLKNLGLPNGLDELKRKLKRIDMPEGAFNNTLIGPKGPLTDISKLPKKALRYLQAHNLTELQIFNPDKGEYTPAYVFDVPKETMVVYITLTVHSTTKAASKMVQKILQLQNQMANYFVNAFENGIPPEKVRKDSYVLFRQFKRLNTEFSALVHKSIAEKRLAIIDIDFDNEQILERTLNMIYSDTKVEPLAVTRTHGGYHIIYDKSVSKDFNAYLFKTFNHNWKKTWARLGITGENVLIFTSSGLVTDKETIAKNVIEWVKKRFGAPIPENAIRPHPLGFEVHLPEGLTLRPIISDEKAFEEFMENIGIKLVKGGIELKSTPMTSIPGTYHGGIKVKMIDYTQYL